MKRALFGGFVLAIFVAWWWPASWPGRTTARLQIGVPPGGAASPGVGRTTAAVFSPPVRVSLTSAAVERVQVAVDGPWQIRAVGSARVLARGDRLAACEVLAGASGLRVGTVDVAATRIELVAEQSPSIWVEGHQYRGSVRLFRRAGGRVLAVNVVPLEAYVASVVDSEMPLTFGDAAREAQAIVARTYALYQMEASRGHPFFDVYASTQSQKYLGVQYRAADGRRLAGESESSRRIVARTAGVVCTWERGVFCTYYSAVCGGRTMAGERVFRDAAPPLQSVPCEWCRDAPLYRWQGRVSKLEAGRALRAYFGGAEGAFGRLERLARSTAGDGAGVPVFEASDGGRPRSISAADLRRQLPAGTLHSSQFTVKEEGDALVFEGRGHGHGVGLCQWGARGQGLAGRTSLEIVRHYYPGCRVVRIVGEL